MTLFSDEEIRKGLQRLGELAHAKNIHRQAKRELFAILPRKSRKNLAGMKIGSTTAQKVICAELAKALFYLARRESKSARPRWNNCLR
jgi:hypothetical protein